MSAVPANPARRSSRCVAMPTGQVLAWHCRAITQPSATSAAVPNPYSSAPSAAAIAMSRPGLEAAVGLQHDAAAQAGAGQRVVRLGQADLPRHAGVLDRRARRRAGAAVVAADLDRVGAGLGHAGRDDADADRRHQLHVHPRRRMERAQVVNQLGEILDAVDVVVHRRRDQRRARLRVAQPRDVRDHLHPGQLTAFARLRALRDLDLQLVGRTQVGRRHAEARRGHLLGAAAVPVAVRGRTNRSGSSPPSPLLLRAPRRFIAVGDRAVRLRRQRADRHRRREEAAADRLDRFDLVERRRRHRLGRRELEQIADRRTPDGHRRAT